MNSKASPLPAIAASSSSPACASTLDNPRRQSGSAAPSSAQSGGTTASPSDPRIVRLQVNTSGAWRNVMDFDVADESDVLAVAPHLFGCATHPGSLRIIVPGETGWLAMWTPAEGWRDQIGEAL